MRVFGVIAFLVSAGVAAAADDVVTIKVRADRVTHAVSPYMVGACIEDVNHEIYGGIYSQMVFGESFAEPPPTPAPKGFLAYGGSWEVKDGVLSAGAGDGPKLVSERAAMVAGEVGVDVMFADGSPG